MFVRWQNSKTVARWKRHDKINRVRAILVESVRQDGKPRQRYVAFLASYEPDEASHRLRLIIQCRFWRTACRVLDRLGNRITPDDRRQIEAALAARVPRPDAEQQQRCDREVENMMRELRALQA